VHKVLQALLDTIQLAAGAVELGSAAYSHTDNSQHLRRRAATKPSLDRALPTERSSRFDPQSFASEPTLRRRTDKSRP